MDSERLWAPWRLDYIAGRDAAEAPPEPSAWLGGAKHDCFLCRAAAHYAQPIVARRRLLAVQVGTHTVSLLNRYPYNNGHLLVSPLRHVAELSDLAPAEHLEAMQRLAHYTELYRRLLNAQGFNIGLNLGVAAGAGVPGHLHWHLVPRWQGDGNFMSTVAGTRVIPQSLEALWEALSEAESASDA